MANPLLPVGVMVKETSVTSGVGNLVLVNVTGFVSCLLAFGLDSGFYYMIRDETANTWEYGWGHLLTDSPTTNTLVRDAVFSNSSQNTSKINFAGNTKDVYTGKGDYASLGFSKYPSVFTNGSKTILSPFGNEYGTQAVTADRLYHIPWICPHPGPYDAVRFEVTSAATGPNARIGVYDLTDDGGPGALLATTGDIDISAGAGTFTDSLSASLYLEEGPYFLSFVADAVCTLRTYTNDSVLCSWLGADNDEVLVSQYLYEALTSWTELPATAAVAGSQTIASNTNTPIIGLTVA